MTERTQHEVAERVVSLLRLAGNETQLTRAMGILMDDNEILRSAAVESLLACGTSINPKDVPTQLRFRNETPALRKRRLRSRRLGRVDWRFSSANAPDFELVVEVKIEAAPGPEQFERYLEDDRVRAAACGGVMALTKHPLTPAELPERVRRHPRWLGHARWHVLLPDLLSRTAQIDSSGDVQVWAALLKHAAETADLGSALPDWDELATATPGEAPAKRATALRAAAKEVELVVADRRSEVKLRKRGEIIFIAVGLELINAIEIRLTGREAVELHVSFWPPRPPARRKPWDISVLALIKAGWTVDRDHLSHPPITLQRTNLPLYLAVAEVLRDTLAPLRAHLLPRYSSVMVGRAATASELEAVKRA